MPMTARSPHEPHRVATALELLFDLVFVVAISQAAAGLHHAISEGHVVTGVLGFAMVFFGIWWAWMNFTWFASAYDCDDVPYRLLVFVQLTGALILAAGVTSMLEARAPNLATIGGYVVMRVALVAQWLRAAAGDPVRRRTALRYAAGVVTVQLSWLSLLFLPLPLGPAFVTFALLELLVPVWAERAAPTTWHPHHICERYGLLTIIVLGESIVSATMAVKDAWLLGVAPSHLLPVAAGGLLLVFSMWWLYFERPAHDLLTTQARAFLWGYGHYFVFASAAAVGAGLAIAADAGAHHGHVDMGTAGLAVAIPASIFLACLAVLLYRDQYGRAARVIPASIPLIIAAAWSPQPTLVIGTIVAGTVAVKKGMGRRG